jgi:hypothetical protein
MTIPFQLTAEDLADSEEIEIKEEHEAWSTYDLADGTTLKIKYPVAKVSRLKKHLPDGSPIYAVANTQPVVRSVNVPKNLKEKPKPSETQYG